MDGQPPCRPSNKHNHHGGAICCYSSMTVANQSPIPPGTSLKGAGRRRCARVLFNLADWPRKKLITNLSNIFQVYQLYLRLVTAKIMVSHPPHTHPRSHILSMLPSIAAACFWLVVVFWSANWWPIYASVYFILIIFALLHSTPQ